MAPAYANDGMPSNVVHGHLESGAAFGCSGDFFDLLTPNGRRFDDGPRRDLLLDMQHLVNNELWPIECGRTAGFFKDGPLTYLQIRPATLPPTESADRYHQVLTVMGGTPREVCDFRFESRIVGTH